MRGKYEYVFLLTYFISTISTPACKHPNQLTLWKYLGLKPLSKDHIFQVIECLHNKLRNATVSQGKYAMMIQSESNPASYQLSTTRCSFQKRIQWGNIWRAQNPGNRQRWWATRWNQAAYWTFACQQTPVPTTDWTAPRTCPCSPLKEYMWML